MHQNLPGIRAAHTLASAAPPATGGASPGEAAATLPIITSNPRALPNGMQRCEEAGVSLFGCSHHVLMVGKRASCVCMHGRRDPGVLGGQMLCCARLSGRPVPAPGLAGGVHCCAVSIKAGSNGRRPASPCSALPQLQELEERVGPLRQLVKGHQRRGALKLEAGAVHHEPGGPAGSARASTTCHACVPPPACWTCNPPPTWEPGGPRIAQHRHGLAATGAPLQRKGALPSGGIASASVRTSVSGRYSGMLVPYWRHAPPEWAAKVVL